ncbi:glycosyltransferase family 4 protein [Frigoribacterium sp. PvP032]|uniref:glycosyltransferase family 4 protein n=1 Tax=Frigoribacterium sp. PvP032 TaxID=2806589 RepID=UPI001AE7A9E0|nr:glycosyltransferase family 4 protein [Frigoribacterium sp. PvP032]MBP1190245.1 glycosyltransferase involved in cell wall biosynthesis [Frigoribacterium sp. PvP032]
MRVYFANHSTAPVNLGGAERSLIRLVEDWRARRPDLEILFLTKAPAGQFIAALRSRGWDFRAFRFRGWAVPSEQPAPAAERAAFATVDYAAVRSMIAEMERVRPDLVVTNTLVAPWAAFAAAALDIPHAWFVREYGDLDHGLQFQSGRASTIHDIGLLSQAVFTNSYALKAHLSQHLDGDAVTVVYPRVDADTVRRSAALVPALPVFAGDAPGLKVTVVGRVEPGKGQYRVIDALGLLETRGIRASLCIVGSWKEPGYDVELRDRARALGVAERVHFVGEQDNPYPFIAAADVCVTPSTLEAFGRTTLEYMIAGRAVVASDAGGSAELVVPGDTGSLFDLDDPRSLSDALAEYAADPDLALRHGAAAARRADEILGGANGNDAAIDRLESLVGGPAYRLPDIARYWFELPDAYSSLGATSARMALGLLASRLRTRTGLVGRAARRPGAVLKRLAGR